ncbi:MAG: T9SS type A sorting domain-containing protein [Flavobacteriaceae bacterium]|nr:T9SS type A sorting domain-containing protein [Bacteroidia bacterium]NNK83906.1 T9SS type A sorting domain-containing protein [Flavobacteriaceae bacterium]
MRIKLLLFTLLLTTLGFSQSVNTYNNAVSANYIIVNGTIDQSTTGADLTWNFNTFTNVGTSSDTHTVPTVAESTNYPGTTSVQTTTSGSTITKVFSKEDSSELSFTGANTTDADFNYITNNAIIGTFPLNYLYSNSDSTAGNLTYTGVGTIPFTGTIDTEIDAYGTLNMNDLGSGAYSGTVTRLKITQTANFTVLTFFPGTATQTTYNYYDNISNNLVFRNTVLDISVPGIGINESNFIMEMLSTVTLSDFEKAITENSINISPNPVKDNIKVSFLESTAIVNISIYDSLGRTVMQINSGFNQIDASDLQNGLYIMVVKTSDRYFTKKFVKQ